MKPAMQIQYKDASAYNKFIDPMRKRAVEDGLDMLEAELHWSTRNLMSFVELAINEQAGK